MYIHFKKRVVSNHSGLTEAEHEWGLISVFVFAILKIPSG
jgi:hypothetical protein